MEYFTHKEVAEKTWQITNTFQQPGALNAFSYLIEGQAYALLIDTIMGWGDLKGYCEKLTDKPIRLVNTHYHLDHTGGNFQFDECWMHYRDIGLFYAGKFKTQEEVFESMKQACREELVPELTIDQVVSQKAMKVFPLYDGDIFDLGDREIEVVEVGGHTPGSIALIDHKTRICYSGDCCNSNTLLGLGSSISVEEYIENLLYFKKFQGEFDMLHGGHESFDPSIIDEGIELFARVIAGTDDKEEAVSMGHTVIYAAAHAKDHRGRADGKRFNMNYRPEMVMAVQDSRQIIGPDYAPGK